MDDDMSVDEEERSLWNINPKKTVVELTDGKIRMREQALYTGSLRVAKAMQTQVDQNMCAWLYVMAESRNGADVHLTLEQAIELRDALDSCIEQTETKLAEYENPA